MGTLTGDAASSLIRLLPRVAHPDGRVAIFARLACRQVRRILWGIGAEMMRRYSLFSTIHDPPGEAVHIAQT